MAWHDQSTSKKLPGEICFRFGTRHVPLPVTVDDDGDDNDDALRKGLPPNSGHLSPTVAGCS